MKFDPEVLQKIVQVIDLNIRPSLNMDGGDISIIFLDGNVLSVKLQGAYSCCPRSAETLKYGIEKTLRDCVSDNILVKAV